MLEDKSYLPDLILTTTDERLIRRTERYQTGIARHYFAPAITVLLLVAGSAAVATWRLVTRLSHLAQAEHITFLQAFTFRVPLDRPLNATELGIISAAATLRAGVLPALFSIAAPFLLFAYHNQNILILKLWNALKSTRDQLAARQSFAGSFGSGHESH